MRRFQRTQGSIFWEQSRETGKSLSPHRPHEVRPGRSLKPIERADPTVILDEGYSS